MYSSNLAVQTDFTAVPDLLSEPPRASLRLITNDTTTTARALRARPSFQARTIVIRDQGLPTFRIR